MAGQSRGRWSHWYNSPLTPRRGYLLWQKVEAREESVELFYKMFTGSQFQRSCSTKNTDLSPPTAPQSQENTWVGFTQLRPLVPGGFPCVSQAGLPSPCSPSLQGCPQPCPALAVPRGHLPHPCSSTPNPEVPQPGSRRNLVRKFAFHNV